MTAQRFKTLIRLSFYRVINNSLASEKQSWQAVINVALCPLWLQSIEFSGSGSATTISPQNEVISLGGCLKPSRRLRLTLIAAVRLPQGNNRSKVEPGCACEVNDGCSLLVFDWGSKKVMLSQIKCLMKQSIHMFSCYC